MVVLMLYFPTFRLRPSDSISLPAGSLNVDLETLPSALVLTTCTEYFVDASAAFAV